LQLPALPTFLTDDAADASHGQMAKVAKDNRDRLNVCQWWAALISVSLALRQTPVYTARPRTRG